MDARKDSNKLKTMVDRAKKRVETRESNYESRSDHYKNSYKSDIELEYIEDLKEYSELLQKAQAMAEYIVEKHLKS